MQLQAVCDHRLMFRDIFVGWPGSSHDGRVFRKSPLPEQLRISPLAADMHLLGDSAYTLAVDMMVPFRDNGHLDCIEKAYNVVHSKTRVCIEHAFGLMNCKFRRMKMLDMHVTDDAPTFIAAVTCYITSSCSQDWKIKMKRTSTQKTHVSASEHHLKMNVQQTRQGRREESLQIFSCEYSPETFHTHENTFKFYMYIE